MPRVLLVFEPPDGGVAVSVAQLAAGLPDYGWEAEVAGPQDSACYGELEGLRVRVHRMRFERGYSTPHRDAAAVAALSKLLTRGDYHLVHCHSSKAGVIGRIAAAIANVPAVYTPHCYPFMMDLPRLAQKATILVERSLGSKTAVTICVSKDEKRAAVHQRIGPPSRLRIVINACPPCDPEVDVDGALLALRSEGPLAAAVTVLRRQKRIDVFLDAIPHVLQRVPNARFAVVGNGPLEGELRAQAARLGLDDSLTFLPFTPPAARHLRAIDLLVLPSDWEGLPISLVEALACGVPQVTTDVGGNAEVVTADTGIVVPPRDPAALAEAVATLLLDGARRTRLGAASRRRHAEHFSLEPMLASTADVYAEAVRGQPAVSARAA